MKKRIVKYILLIIVVIVIVLLIATREGSKIEGVEKIQNMGNKHISSVDSPHQPYNSNPPTSGPHVGFLAPWGISKEPISDQIQVHNLEDGGVIIQYHPDKISYEQIKQLEKIINNTTRHLILAPRSNMEYNLVLTAWNQLLALEMVDYDKINAFINSFEGVDHHIKKLNN